MKNLFLITVLVSFTMCLQAQFLTSKLNSNDYVTELTSQTYSIENTTAGYWYVIAPKIAPTAQMVTVKLDSIAGDHTNVAVQLQGRYNSHSAWANVGSAVNWTGATADTTFNIVNTTENGYRHFKLLFTGTGTGETQISTLFFKQWNGTF